MKRHNRIGTGRFLIIAVISLFVLSAGVFSAGERPLMRFPDIHGNTIAFVYGEDIWSVPAEGGVATRLTIHDGMERFPKFSPDGSLIAFSGEYDGNTDVYVMNKYGGDITRLTYHPWPDIVVGWHPTKNKIMFRSPRYGFGGFNCLYLVSPDGTGLEKLIMHEASQGTFSPDGSKIAYNKIAREHRTWKHYQGGMAQDVYLFDFEAMEESKLIDAPGTDRLPMWIGEKICFSSDRDGRLNIYAYDFDSDSVEQLTDHREYDVRRPSMGGDRIVYELGGTLWVLDTGTGRTEQVPVEIRTDAPEVRPYLKKVDENITSVDCSPEGNRALITARGELFTVPREEGPTRNLSRDSGSRDRGAVWAPEGERIAFLSDRHGEYDIFTVDPVGDSKPVRLTSLGAGFRHSLEWSPDGKKLAFADQTLRLRILDVDSREITDVDRAGYETIDVSLERKPISEFTWSPDGRWLAYAKMNADLLYQVYIYSLETGESRTVSNGLFNDFEPVFSPDGEHLFFLSNRRFDPTFGDFEWEMVYRKTTGIYCLTLSPEDDPLFPFESDEAVAGEEEERGKKEADEGRNGIPEVEIDFDGVTERVEAVPLPRGNYRELSANESSLFYLNAEEGDFNRFEFRELGPRDLFRFSIDEREEEKVIKAIDDYRLSSRGTVVVYRKSAEVGLIHADSEASGDEAVDLSDLKMLLDPLAEWTQIYHEAWRMERDFFYDPGMHGLDWEAIGEKYGRLLPFMSCRDDLRYLVGELIGELGTSHTYVFGGDRKREAEEIEVGMLGVDWERDEESGRYRFGKIYRIPDWTREIFPPLGRPEIHVAEGDYLLSVNGQEVTTDRNIYSYFTDLAGRQITLMVNRKPGRDGATEITVEPLPGERVLRYLAWVEHNRRVVDEASGGLIGYIHLPDTYTGSARIFPKYYYSQSRKKGIIVDGRFNAGGLDPGIFLRRLDKDVLVYWTRRYSHDQTTPEVAIRAHLACLTNRQAGSGGDMLPMEFQMRDMGPVIGTRTWGGLVGVSMWIDLVDGGGLSAPDYRVYDRNGNWVVENVGVVPDIEIDLDPMEMARGHDAQLMKAVEYLMERIEEAPLPWPEHEPFPTLDRQEQNIR